LAVVHDEGRPVLAFTDAYGGSARGRALVAHDLALRDGRVTAVVKPMAMEAGPHMDREACREALVGVIFRVQTSRAYYQFALEGRRRAVLYRRKDDEWFELAFREVDVPEAYLTLVVDLDGDGIRCRCPELGVDFFTTDTTFRTGKVGVRALCRARLAALTIAQTEAQQGHDTRQRARYRVEEAARGADIPDPVLAYEYDLEALGGEPIFQDFAEPGRFDLLVPGAERVRALKADGEVLWDAPMSLRSQIVFSKQHGDHGRLIYAFTGVRSSSSRPGVRGEVQDQTVADEMVVLRGADGAVVARAKLPDLPPKMRYVDYAQTSGNLTGTGGFDIVLREWRQDKEGGGEHLWAYDKDLNLLWQRTLHQAYYGHHYAVQFFDVNGDGRDELLAGGTLYDTWGNIAWVHDRQTEMLRITGAKHYDAVVLGDLAGDASVDPVAFLLGGSAGVYVVDGLTGRTRAVHRVGHAQGRFVGKVRGDLPGKQVLVVTRWGNYGILTLFSGHGDRLWSIQPDYIGQGSCPVTWGDSEIQLIWMNTSGPVQAFYDGYGQRVKLLPALSRLWGDRMRRDVGSRAVRIGSAATDYLAMTVEGRLYAYGPET
jgi:hypothetical protein